MLISSQIFRWSLYGKKVNFLYDGVSQVDIKVENRKIFVSYRYIYKYKQCDKFRAVNLIKDVTKRNERKNMVKKCLN